MNIIVQLLKYVYLKARYGKRLQAAFSSMIDLASRFEGNNRVGRRSVFSGVMGYGSYICDDCVIPGNVGRFTSIAQNVKCSLGIHPTGAPYVTTSPLFYSLRKGSFAEEQLFEEIKPKINIGNDCWIGENVFIGGGLNIGDGAVVYAGAVVIADVPPYAIVGGVPARIIRYRYDAETIDFLLRVKWWERAIRWLQENWRLLTDMDMLKTHLSEE